MGQNLWALYESAKSGILSIFDYDSPNKIYFSAGTLNLKEIGSGLYLLASLRFVLIHAMASMSTAGVMLCSANIALKLAPHGKATAYLAENALISGVTATMFRPSKFHRKIVYI